MLGVLLMYGTYFLSNCNAILEALFMFRLFMLGVLLMYGIYEQLCCMLLLVFMPETCPVQGCLRNLSLSSDPIIP